MNRIARQTTLGAAALAALLVACGVPARAAGPITLDPGLPEYAPVEGVSGNLSSVGSDTLNNLMTFWAEALKAHYPNVNIQIEGKGSSTAPPALIAGLAQLGPMSRPMKPSEIDSFEAKFGYKPTEIKVAVDALAVFVNKDNPIAGLSLPQVDAVFSKSNRKGWKGSIATWGDLGLTGDWASRPISLYGRNSASGTYGFFKELVLGNGDFKDEVKEQPGSASVVQGISVDRYGIGYSGIGYTTPGVRAVPLAAKAGGEFADADQASAYSGKYPVTRFLYVYVNKVPGQGLDPLTRELLRLVLSREGQQATVKDGYYPLPAKVLAAELKKIK